MSHNTQLVGNFSKLLAVETRFLCLLTPVVFSAETMAHDMQEENNNAVEQLLMGHPRDAINTLLQAMDIWRIDLISQTSLVSEHNLKNVSGGLSSVPVDGCAMHLYSVDLSHDMDIVEPAFPFRWYGKPIAVANGSEWDDEDRRSRPMNSDLNLVVILYNLAIAYQLDAAQKKNQESNLATGRRSCTAAFESYTSALKVLLYIREREQWSGRDLTQSERLDFGLLHAAIVNNMLFLYSQSADVQGMVACLSVLRQVLSFTCSGLPPCDLEEFTFFHINAILFPNPGSLSLSPAA